MVMISRSQQHFVEQCGLYSEKVLSSILSATILLLLLLPIVQTRVDFGVVLCGHCIASQNDRAMMVLRMGARGVKRESIYSFWHANNSAATTTSILYYDALILRESNLIKMPSPNLYDRRQLQNELLQDNHVRQ